MLHDPFAILGETLKKSKMSDLKFIRLSFQSKDRVIDSIRKQAAAAHCSSISIVLRGSSVSRLFLRFVQGRVRNQKL